MEPGSIPTKDDCVSVHESGILPDMPTAAVPAPDAAGTLPPDTLFAFPQLARSILPASFSGLQTFQLHLLPPPPPQPPPVFFDGDFSALQSSAWVNGHLRGTFNFAVQSIREDHG